MWRMVFGRVYTAMAARHTVPCDDADASTLCRVRWVDPVKNGVPFATMADVREWAAKQQRQGMGKREWYGYLMMSGEIQRVLCEVEPHADESWALQQLADCEFVRAVISEEPDDMHAALDALERAEEVADERCEACAGGAGLGGFFGAVLGTRDEERLDTTWIEEKGADDCLVVAESRLLRGLLLMRMGDFFKGAMSLRSSFKMYQSLEEVMGLREYHARGCVGENASMLERGVQERARELRDGVSFGLGYHHFVMSLVPRSFHWLLEAIGMHPHKELGLQELHMCAQSHSRRAPLSAFCLLALPVILEGRDHAAAERMYDEAVQKYPDSPLVHYLGGYIYRRQGKLPAAEKCFRDMQRLAIDPYLAQLRLISHYELGWVQQWRGNLRESIKEWSHFLKHTRAPSFRTYCAYQLSQSIALSGGTYDEVEPVMALANKYQRDHYTWDAFAVRKAGEFARNRGIPSTELVCMRAQLLVEGHRFEDALRVLDELDATLHRQGGTEEGDDWAMFFYCKGRALKGLGRLDDARTMLRRVEEVPGVERETYTKPYAAVEYAEALMIEQRWVDALETLQRVNSSYRDYDFDKPLQRRMMANMDICHNRLREVD